MGTLPQLMLIYESMNEHLPLATYSQRRQWPCFTQGPAKMFGAFWNPWFWETDILTLWRCRDGSSLDLLQGSRKDVLWRSHQPLNNTMSLKPQICYVGSCLRLSFNYQNPHCCRSPITKTYGLTIGIYQNDGYRSQWLAMPSWPSCACRQSRTLLTPLHAARASHQSSVPLANRRRPKCFQYWRLDPIRISYRS